MADVEFIDCSTVNVQYDATGKATLSFNIVKNSANAIDVSRYKSVVFGFIRFDGVIMSLTQNPIKGSYDPSTGIIWVEWQIQLAGVGNRSYTQPSDWGA